jgi:hypothetical protein
MPTKLILTASAISLGIIGVLLTFMPAEIASTLGWQSNAIIFQIIGALYFSYAMINWMSKANLIGGIYNRPLAVANLTHFCVGALALLKMPDKVMVHYLITVIYAVFAVAFGLILFTHPIKEKTE